MTPRFDAAAKALDVETNAEAIERPENSNIIKISEEDLVRGRKDNHNNRVSRKAGEDRAHAKDLLPYPNYNDEPDPAVKKGPLRFRIYKELQCRYGLQNHLEDAVGSLHARRCEVTV